MKKLVSFDAAGTLVNVGWQPAKFAVGCAKEAGLALREAAGDEYDQLLRSRWREYCGINLTRSEEQGDAFWNQLTSDWLAQQGHEAARAQEVMAIARERLYGSDSTVFQLFPDTMPALDALKAAGVRMVVTSNWDYSLHRILRRLGVYGYFERVYASLEEGPEKPDPALFHLVLESSGVAPADALHVGDDPLDDLQGAKGVGMAAALIDRSRTGVTRPYISSLTDVPAILDWEPVA